MPRLRSAIAYAAFALVVIAPTALAQEGFPLDGTWRGRWGDPLAPNHVVIVMQWNGETVTGRINPGPRSIDFTDAVLEPSNWAVRIEAVDAAGERILIEGTLEDIGSYNRSITGTWTQGGSAHPFTISRE
jgi:hypothetical protein